MPVPTWCLLLCYGFLLEFLDPDTTPRGKQEGSLMSLGFCPVPVPIRTQYNKPPLPEPKSPSIHPITHFPSFEIPTNTSRGVIDNTCTLANCIPFPIKQWSPLPHFSQKFVNDVSCRVRTYCLGPQTPTRWTSFLLETGSETLYG